MLGELELAENTFRNHFGRGRYADLATDGLDGMARLVHEAKMWTFEPYAQGWREQRRRLQLAPRLSADSLLAVLVLWAYAHPVLARLEQDRLPQPAKELLEGLHPMPKDPTPVPAINPLIDCARSAVAHTFDETRDRLPIASVLNKVSSDFARIEFKDGLNQEGARLLGGIGRFMTLLSDAAEKPDPRVVAGLADALRELRAITASIPSSDNPSPSRESPEGQDDE